MMHLVVALKLRTSSTYGCCGCGPGTKVQTRRIDLQKLFFNNVLAFSPSSRAPASRCHCTLGRLGFPHSSSIIVFPALGSQLGDVFFLQKLFYNFRHTRWKCSFSNQRISGHFITPTPLISSSRSCVNFPPLGECMFSYIQYSPNILTKL